MFKIKVYINIKKLDLCKKPKTFKKLARSVESESVMRLYIYSIKFRQSHQK